MIFYLEIEKTVVQVGIYLRAEEYYCSINMKKQHKHSQKENVVFGYFEKDVTLF